MQSLLLYLYLLFSYTDSFMLYHHKLVHYTFSILNSFFLSFLLALFFSFSFYRSLFIFFFFGRHRLRRPPRFSTPPYPLPPPRLFPLSSHYSRNSNSFCRFPTPIITTPTILFPFSKYIYCPYNLSFTVVSSFGHRSILFILPCTTRLRTVHPFLLHLLVVSIVPPFRTRRFSFFSYLVPSIPPYSVFSCSNLRLASQLPSLCSPTGQPTPTYHPAYLPIHLPTCLPISSCLPTPPKLTLFNSPISHFLPLFPPTFPIPLFSISLILAVIHCGINQILEQKTSRPNLLACFTFPHSFVSSDTTLTQSLSHFFILVLFSFFFFPSDLSSPSHHNISSFDTPLYFVHDYGCRSFS